MTSPRFLVVGSESAREREERRRRAGHSAGESYGATLEQMVPGARVERTTPSDPGHPLLSADEIAGFDAVFLSGSPLHVYDDSPEVDAQLRFMGRVFASGTPSFGSCAGLQVAVAAAGGRVRPLGPRREAGLTRGTVATEAGRDHPLLRGRPVSWDALTIHGDEVEELPPGAVLLATSPSVRVQAAEIRVDGAVFWGVQYHPELSPGEIGAALRRDAESLQEAGLARSDEEVERRATLFDRLHEDPDDRAVRWHLGVTDQAAREDRRRTELRNFVDHLVEPTRRVRRRVEAEPA